MRMPAVAVVLMSVVAVISLACSDATLVPGEASPGPDVAILAQKLAQLGFLVHGAREAAYDPPLVEAVRRFQAWAGLPIDGVVDGAVWHALETRLPTPIYELDGGVPVAAMDGAVEIEINLDRMALYLKSGGVVVRTYPIAQGRPGDPSPVGEWRIINKAHRGAGPFGTRWMGLNVPWGTYGVHGTNNPGSIGTRASSGCIRMFNKHVERVS